ncbi:MAG: DUF4863 family protein [Magnetospiraceae bacterium]
MTPETFKRLMAPVTEAIAGKAVDQALATVLNETFPYGGAAFKEIEAACHQAIDAGWMCAEGGAGRRYGRVIKPEPGTHDLSVDVVQIENFVGPHHEHPNGEICMIMPENEGATFDGMGGGWCVNEPGSAHYPTVDGGSALVLYLLPGGKIWFTGR